MIKAGSLVGISGLASRADLNGQRATILSFDATAQRYGIHVVGGEKVRIKAANLELLPRGKPLSDANAVLCLMECGTSLVVLCCAAKRRMRGRPRCRRSCP